MKPTKWMLCALALFICVGLTACGGQDEGAKSDHIPMFQEYLAGEGTKILYYADKIGKDETPRG